MPVTPKDASDDCIARSRALLNQAAVAGLPAGVRDDLARLGLVMAVAALDTYMHRVVLNKASWNPSRALAAFKVPFKGFAKLAEQTVAAHREQRKSRPWVHVKRVLQEQLLGETLQGYEAVGNAMAMAGVSKGWGKVAQRLGMSAADIKARLGAIVHRRNRIVHEGDLRRLERPRTIEHEPLTVAAATADVDWLETLLNAIDVVLA